MGSTPAEEIIPHTINLPLQISVFLTHWGDKRSPFFTSYKPLAIRSKQVKFRFITKGNHIPLFLCSTSYALWRSQDEPFDFYKGLQHRIRATNFSLLNIRDAVFLVIGFAVCSQKAREIDVAVSKRSFKAIFTIIRSSCLVVIGGLPVLGFDSSVLSALNQLITW